MDMELMDVYRRPYSSLEVQGYNDEPQHQQHHHQQPPHGQHQGQQYGYWNHHHLMALYQHQQRAAAAMMGQGNMHASKQTEPKPRLAKDEVELLEREFAKNPKPNSSTKRELAEQMGVEVPRINNWFQNRRAKEKQIRKTAEFEAQQLAGKRAESSESKSSDDQNESASPSDFYGGRANDQGQPITISTAPFGGDNNLNNNDRDSQLERRPSGFHDHATQVAGLSPTPQGNNGTPETAEKDNLTQAEYHSSHGSPHQIHPIPELAPSANITESFSLPQPQQNFQRQLPYGFGVSEPPPTYDGLPAPSFDAIGSHSGMMHNNGSFGSFPERDYFMAAPQTRYPSEMITEGTPEHRCEQSLPDQGPDSLVKVEEAVSPYSMPESPPSGPANLLRFKSPPPPADIAGRRNMRRPAPLGLSSLRNGPHGPAPKTGIDAPRRSETASPMRRISSATGSLHGRVQKSFAGSNGPRSPFNLDRNKEAILQTLQSTTHSPIMASLNSAMSPLSPDGMGAQGVREGTIGTNASDEEQGYTFGSLGAVGSLPLYKPEPSIKTPPGTPGLSVNFRDPFYPGSVEQHGGWNYVPQDEPLPTPSLCSHGGSELEFSMAPQMPGYVASQPVTPSFPPSIGPTYNGFFGTSLNNAEYNFPDSYPPESSARSSPGGPPKSKQFQFAQNVTPQDYNTEKA
ncbi:pah3 homeobox protein encoded by the pah3 protein [Naviculisporaceae sp. PSN 640]